MIDCPVRESESGWKLYTHGSTFLPFSGEGQAERHAYGGVCCAHGAMGRSQSCQLQQAEDEGLADYMLGRSGGCREDPKGDLHATR